jgi:hypothetical protein
VVSGAWHVYERSFSGIDQVNGAREFLQGQVRVTRIDEHHAAFRASKLPAFSPLESPPTKLAQNNTGCGHHVKGSRSQIITLIEASIDELELLASRIGIAVHHVPENIWQVLDLRM